jgi:phospholipid/cholesterol/gamma-HCH transport system permease protein
VNLTIKFLNFTGTSTITLYKRLLHNLWFIGDTATALSQSLSNPMKIRWRDTIYYMDLCGRQAFPIVSLICFLMGLILGFQSAVQMHALGADIYVADLVGFSILRELGPLMVALICTGRAGSAFAAEIGTMKVNEEIDAMTTMGFNPTRLLVVPKIIALVTVMPLLTIVGDFFGLLGGLTVGVSKLDLLATTYMERTFMVLQPMDLLEGVGKSFVFGLLIAGVGCLRGMQSSPDAQGVGRATTSAVVSGIFLVVLADALITIILTGWRI